MKNRSTLLICRRCEHLLMRCQPEKLMSTVSMCNQAGSPVVPVTMATVQITCGKVFTHQWWRISTCRLQQSRSVYGSKLYSGRRTVDPFKNPIDEVQPFVEVPIIPTDGNIFNPSRPEMLAAADLFTPGYKHDIMFLTSAVQPDQLPDTDVPEVAFIGRSNVGKSSLIQAIFQRAPDVLVRVSKKPGHTRSLHFFQVGRSLTLVDMPGYGYNMPHHFVESVEGYLHSRKGLCRTFLLVDSLVGFTKADWLGLEMMEQAKTPYCIVLTKCDKASKHVILRNLMGVVKIREENTHCCLPQPFLLSSVTGAGVPLLQAFIAYVTGNLSIKGV